MVDTPVATFGLNEITGFLEEDGYTPGTAAFNDEKFRWWAKESLPPITSYQIVYLLNGRAVLRAFSFIIFKVCYNSVMHALHTAFYFFTWFTDREVRAGLR